MKVFMSWSGQRSKLTAELLHDWIKCVVQASQPWISSKGIERGALWFSEINNELKDTTVGVICLTQENKNAPWILFEAGALAKGLSTTRVCTFLVDIESHELQPPLAQFNHTFPTRDGIWSLVNTLNNGLEEKRLDLKVLERVFDTYWPQFESQFKEIIANNPVTTVIPPRDEKEILAEILDATRSVAKRVQLLEERREPLGTQQLDLNRYFRSEKGGERSFSDEDRVNYSKAVHLAMQNIDNGGSLTDTASEITKLFGYNARIAYEIIDLVIRPPSIKTIVAG